MKEEQGPMDQRIASLALDFWCRGEFGGKADYDPDDWKLIQDSATAAKIEAVASNLINIVAAASID